MNNWKEFVFNAPYVGGKIERINNVILPQQYVGFMKKHNGGKGDIGETWLELYPCLLYTSTELLPDPYRPQRALTTHSGLEVLKLRLAGLDLSLIHI